MRTPLSEALCVSVVNSSWERFGTSWVLYVWSCLRLTGSAVTVTWRPCSGASFQKRFSFSVSSKTWFLSTGACWHDTTEACFSNLLVFDHFSEHGSWILAALGNFYSDKPACTHIESHLVSLWDHYTCWTLRTGLLAYLTKSFNHQVFCVWAFGL